MPSELNPVARYITELDRIYRRGDATEHSYRAALQILLQSWAPGIEATNEPQQIAGNAPDYVVRRGPAIIGNVEAKDVGEHLDRVLKSPQLKRYRDALPNLILTNYLDLIWIENGEVRLRARLGEVAGRGIVANADSDAQWQRVAQAFFTAVTPVVRTPKQLAELLAAQTHLLKDATLGTLRAEGEQGALAGQHRAFRELLVPNLSEEDFADMFAQTVAYGLFTARVFDPTPLDFSLLEAERLIPRANPFLRQFFHFVGFDLSRGVEWIVQGIVNVLKHADLAAVLQRQGRRRGFEDPIFHFYETFLAEYDPKLRESRGVYYTPEPVVDFIVRGIDHLLRTAFGRLDGLADRDTVILDPATGTATFLRQVVETIHAHQIDAGLRGMWPDYVRRHLLPRLYGFELMMAPYTVAHLKMALQLTQRGFEFVDGDRLNIYLTNTLDRIQGRTGEMMAQWLTRESEGAERVKREAPVQVVLGNPPYLGKAGKSTNKSVWITELLELYKREPDGSRLNEKAKGGLNADEIKFIRFAHWRVMQTGHGIVGYIAPHTWLDGTTFRGMRAALLRDFDEIYILDLHGNSNKKEVTPESQALYGVDKNVFDILQGVAIVFLIRKPGERQRRAVVRHAELWGTRESKYSRLEGTSFDSAGWHELSPLLPQLSFVPIDRGAWEEYERGTRVTEILPVNSIGFLTARDDLTIHFDAASAWETARTFSTLPEEEARSRFKIKKDVRDWKVEWAQEDLRKDGPDRSHIIPVAYRPFDTRFTYYSGTSRGFHCYPRAETMSHLLGTKNLALITSRLTKGEDFAHASVSSMPVETISLSSTTSNNAYVFPLWLMPDLQALDPAEQVHHPNLDRRYLRALAQALGVETVGPFGLPDGVTPEDVLHYIYAVLHTPEYRRRFAPYLRSDFPRIPFPPNVGVFRELAVTGEKLTALHMLGEPSLARGGPAFNISGDNIIEKVQYTQPRADAPGRVWINARQHFEGVEPETWVFRVGGYQVLEKWLKDRKGRALDSDDVAHYRKVVLALDATRDVMRRLDVKAAPLFL